MANAWIEHVKEYAKKNGMKYPVAVGDPGCKAAYNKGNNTTQKKNKRYKRGGEKPDPNPNSHQEADYPNTHSDKVADNDPDADNDPKSPVVGGKRRSRKAKGSNKRNKKSQKRRRRK